MRRIVIPREFQSKMKELLKEYAFIFLSAQIGWGKTSVVQAYLEAEKIPYTYVTGPMKDFEEKVRNAAENIIVIDDFQDMALENEVFLREHLHNLCRSHQFILLSRGCLPSWLKPFQITGQLGTLSKKLLALGEREVKEFCELHQMDMDEIDLYRINQNLQGYPLALAFLSRFDMEEHKTSEDMVDTISQDIFDYYDEMLFQNWSRDLYSLMLHMGGFDSFTIGLAVMVCGISSVQELLDEAYALGSFLERKGDEYTIEPFFRKYLLYKQERVLSSSSIYGIYHNAGLYYELQSDIKKALKYYHRCGDEDKVRELLIRNSNLHPGLGNYLEMEEYYRSLPKEMILESSALMCGMSLLCSLNMQVEESEYWYTALQEYVKSLKKTDLEYKYGKGKLYWLDLSLPHRGSVGVDKMLLNAVTMKQNKELSLRELSVTSNLPSVLNGGKDFSCWVPKSDMLYPIMKTAFPIVLGQMGQGLTDICLAEKMLETKDADTYQIMRCLNSGIEQATAKGKLEVQFVGTALMYRLYLSQGKADVAYNLMTDFKKVVEQKGNTQMLQNLQAVLANHNLKMGRSEKVAIWMREEAPNENGNLKTMERYRYMVKARCYIFQKKYMEAISLLNRMIEYGKLYDRTIIRIQARLLLAVVLYRMKDKSWKEVLKESLLEAQTYHYIQMIADEGSGVLPLMLELENTLDKHYKKELLLAIREDALFYPNYLKNEEGDTESLTSTEKQVLKLLGRGMKNKEIAEFLNISLNTVAYHTKNIYQKLGVNNRTQATNIAKTMEL